jgi:hypothetical protein
LGDKKSLLFQEELAIMVKNVDNLLVLFHDRKKKSQKALNALEHIDDDTDKVEPLSENFFYSIFRRNKLECFFLEVVVL